MPGNSTHPLASKRQHHGLWLLIIAILVSAAYAWFLAAHGTSYASDSDASGYFNSARMLARGQISVPVRPIAGLTAPDWNPYFQEPLGFTLQPGTKYLVPTYPIGLPLHLLLAAKVAGWAHAAILVNVLNALAAGLLTVALGRVGFGLRWGWALAAGAILWACPLFLLYALKPMSDDLALTWTLLALFSAWCSRDHGNWWAVLAGAAIGIAVLVRPTDALVLLPVAVILGGNARRWLACVAGGLPWAVLLAIYNWMTYRQVFTSGYGDVSTLFNSAHVPSNLSSMLVWTLRLLTPLSLLALALPRVARQHLRLVAALAVWIIALAGLYAFYFYTGETWWYLRFLLPLFPVIILAGMTVAQRLGDLLPSAVWRRSLAAILLLLVLGWQIRLGNRLNVLVSQQSEHAYYETVQWLHAHAPGDAIMVAMQLSGALHYYIDYPLVRYDLINPAQFAELRAAASAQQRPIYAPLFPFEVEAVTQKLGGHWEQAASINPATHITIWRLQP